MFNNISREKFLPGLEFEPWIYRICASVNHYTIQVKCDIQVRIELFFYLLRYGSECHLFQCRKNSNGVTFYFWTSH